MKINSLTQGSVFKALIAFSAPMIVTNTVSILFHATDVTVLALLADGPAVAAVGACGSLITLLVSLFSGFATGANVLISKRIGAEDEEGTKRSVGTSLVIGLLSGLALMTVALIFAKDLLLLMKCRPAVLDMATLYMRIYFLGMPIMMLKSFATAVLRASGDSVRPMAYMIVCGILNVFSNFFFVAVFDMTVEGVALATLLSSAVGLALVLIRLIRSKGICRVQTKYLRICRAELAEILRVGFPTVLCSIFFYFANVVLASAVNSIGIDAMEANSISGQFDGVIYTVGAAIATATSVMVGQNYGAKQFERIRKIIKTSILYVSAVSIFLGVSFVLLADPLLSILSDDPTVIAIAKDRMTLLCLTYFITSIMEVFAFSLRALKQQNVTAVVGAICGTIRCLWTWYIWPLGSGLSWLFACYAISAFLAIVIYCFSYKKAVHSFEAPLAQT